MTLPRAFSSVDAAAETVGRPLHLAIGMFDGVHLGHQAVIGAAVHGARRSGGGAAVLTFRPHPSALFRPDKPTRLILNPDIQAELLGRIGVDAVITQVFTPEFAGIAAEDFLPWLVARLPGLAAAYVGQNWRFGAGRRGDVAQLVATGNRAGVSVYSAPPVMLDGKPVNSTRIRELLEAGEMGVANALLGYNYFARGVVVPGKRLGRTLGFPTLNLPWDPELKPRRGVYSVRVAGPKSAGQPRSGVANYGLRPTVEAATAPLLEVHLREPCPFGEGDAIAVEWLGFIRPELKFATVDALKAQIARDVAHAGEAVPPL